VEIEMNRTEKIEQFSKMTLNKIAELPKVVRIDANYKEVEYIDRADIMRDYKNRGVGNVYNSELLELNEYEYLLLQEFVDKYEKSYGVQSILYPDIEEVFEGIVNKIELIKY
jgi:hypothetical protein